MELGQASKAACESYAPSVDEIILIAVAVLGALAGGIAFLRRSRDEGIDELGVLAVLAVVAVLAIALFMIVRETSCQ